MTFQSNHIINMTFQCQLCSSIPITFISNDLPCMFSFQEALSVPWRTLPRKVSKLYFAMRGVLIYFCTYCLLTGSRKRSELNGQAVSMALHKKIATAPMCGHKGTLLFLGPCCRFTKPCGSMILLSPRTEAGLRFRNFIYAKPFICK